MMGNEKGYTLLEVVLTLAISSIIVFNVFYIPTQFVTSNAHYSKFSSETSDIAVLRKTISKDLRNGDVVVDKNDERKVSIGDKNYYFGEQVVREFLTLTEKQYVFEFDGNYIEVLNDNYKFKYNVRSSFNKGGDGDE